MEMQHSFLLIRRAVARVSAFVPGPQAPAPTGKGRGAGDSYTHSEVHYRRGGLSFSSVQSLSRV